MKSDSETHHRRSIRLDGYDYSRPGIFFVTLCAYQRDEIFGSVLHGEMQLSPLGKIARNEWFHSAEIRPEIQLFKTEFALMPNHLHGIVWIVDPVRSDGIPPDPNGETDYSFEEQDSSLNGKGACHAPLRRVPRSLGAFIGGFKAAVTSRAGREFDAANIWQRNYYEHIVRNEEDLNNIRVYIQTNPLHWQEDQLHPLALPNRFNQEKS